MLWGIDLGGTKIEGAILDPHTGDVAFRERIETGASHGYDHIVSRIALMVDQMAEHSQRPDTIGIGTPGTLNVDSGLMKNCNTACLNGKPLLKDLEAAIPCHICMANDANCFALAESTLGAAQGAAVVFGVIMGTGVGGGVIIHGRVLEGRHGIAGEWGHNVIDAAGDDCYCGLKGCVETVLSGPALERYYERRSGRFASLKEIVAARPSDDVAEMTFQRLVHEFGRAIASVLNILDPDVVVLGGGVGNVPNFVESIPSAVKPWIFNREIRTRFVRPTLGDSAGVIGAAMLTQ